MEFIENILGRLIPVKIEGRKLRPFQGAFADDGGGRKRVTPPIPVSKPGQNKLCSLREAIEKSGLKDGYLFSSSSKGWRLCCKYGS